MINETKKHVIRNKQIAPVNVEAYAESMQSSDSFNHQRDFVKSADFEEYENSTPPSETVDVYVNRSIEALDEEEFGKYSTWNCDSPGSEKKIHRKRSDSSDDVPVY